VAFPKGKGMGIINWCMQRSMAKEARRLAKEVSRLYPESKARHPSASETEIIRGMAFDEEALASISESSRKRIDACCETVQGFCYMMALDIGSLTGLMNLRSLQFTYYMDRALEVQGFPPQSKEQKARILEVMGLRIAGWDRISGDADDYSQKGEYRET
jgi:hypothetical protein